MTRMARLRPHRASQMIEDNQQLFSAIRLLAETWCDRRCFMALRFLLRGYPMVSPLADGWHELLVALKDVRAFARSELTDTELQTLSECIVAIERTVKAT